jgi:hypothetical protein
MSIGYNHEMNVNKGDTAEVFAYIYDRNDSLVSEEDLIGVTFSIQKPDGEKEEVVGEIVDVGTGRALFESTDQTGHYTGIASFDTVENGKRSVRTDFEVIDPFKEIVPSPSYVAAILTWQKIEDCFDGEEEGPWLADMTQNYFNRTKMETFLNEALFDINVQNPPTDLQLNSFIRNGQDEEEMPQPTSIAPLLAQGMLLTIIRHLMRSYTEQPSPVGAQIAWHDRRDYLQRWREVYEVEQQQYQRMLALYKRKFLNLGQSKVLIHNKAGRMMSAPMRTRYVGRGAIW